MSKYYVNVKKAKECDVIIGPLFSYKSAENYKKFVDRMLKGDDKACTFITVECYPVNQYGAPENYAGLSYPAPTEGEIHHD